MAVNSGASRACGIGVARILRIARTSLDAPGPAGVQRLLRRRAKCIASLSSGTSLRT